MNGQIGEKYLPVGTVVLLRNGTKRVMINGFCTMDASKPDKVYDYSGVLFPEGSLSSDQTLLFDHEQIVRVDHVGLVDQEEKDFKVKLAQIVAASQNGGTAGTTASNPTAPASQPAPAAPTPFASSTPQNPSTTSNPNTTSTPGTM